MNNHEYIVRVQEVNKDNTLEGMFDGGVHGGVSN